ncbi:GSCOCT00012195001.2-RA-CDS [Cotesia congregata]|uniref:Venom protein 10 n=1 Tax=Cotesia congregata TaxID=51543 RepID=A0A8J2E8C7_COTCN|nr:GSCOCT00012195001.2-RA-CDS [Cotesia congregata]CAG5073087.1 Putative venom protein 10 [Cotesia congregata]
MSYKLYIFLCFLTLCESLRIRREQETSELTKVTESYVIYHNGQNVSQLLFLYLTSQLNSYELAYTALHYHYIYDQIRNYCNEVAEFDDIEDIYYDLEKSSPTFNNEGDSDEVTESSKANIVGLSDLAPSLHAQKMILVNPNHHPWVSALTLLDSILEFFDSTSKSRKNID